MRSSARPLFFFVAVVLFAVTAQAADDSSKLQGVRLLAKRIDNLERSLRGKVRKLSAIEQGQLVAKPSSLPKDSDGDGVSDNMEHALGSGVCKADSDDDGLDDRTELRRGSKISDPDSDDDGVGDNNEVEDRGTVSSAEGGQFVLNGNTWGISDSTEYRGGSVSTLASGTCVEVEGHLLSGVRTAVKIRFEDSCAAGPDRTPVPGSTPETKSTL